MSVVVGSYLQLLQTQDNVGWRFAGGANSGGDGTGGQVDFRFYMPINWSYDAYLVLDRWLAYSTNANTDEVQLLPSGFDGGSFVIDSGVTSTPFGSNFIFSRQYSRGLYIGRSNNQTNTFLNFLINPNTNLKSYTMSLIGRLLLRYPSVDRDGIG